ncbi:hypothetical protein MKK70_15505 [Methylobacterium sp. E-041]|jgi:hypothetical protein|uniref:hypothetical protein n=1 Tax=unclassified Methylobacterium TaxID=2615210 RepID=UPI001FBA193A|nr:MULTISPECIES: hypothetical protein [unclassified Methylobacterium]MCJ2106755.1 hypothetical protein [Methylobacterium sp. E-041]MCJ2109947.1 hypothetical protein [Methylobacterium sp. E-025]
MMPMNSKHLRFADLDRLPVPPCYHAFLVNADGRVVRLENLPALDDQDALRQAEAFVAGHAVELWHGMRFMERFPLRG